MKMDGNKVKQVFFLFTLVRRRGWKKNVLQINTGLLLSAVILNYSSMRLQPFLLAPHHQEERLRRSPTEILYCPESGQGLLLENIVVTLFYLLFTNDKQKTKGHKGQVQTRHIVLACIVPLQLKQTWKCDFYVFFAFQFSYPKNLFMKQTFYRIYYPVTKELLSLGVYIQESTYS